jgi:hypothetical protein
MTIAEFQITPPDVESGCTDALRLQAEELKNSVEQQRELVEVSRQQVQSEREALAYERTLRHDSLCQSSVLRAGVAVLEETAVPPITSQSPTQDMTQRGFTLNFNYQMAFVRPS